LLDMAQLSCELTDNSTAVTADEDLRISFHQTKRLGSYDATEGLPTSDIYTLHRPPNPTDSPNLGPEDSRGLYIHIKRMLTEHLACSYQLTR
jgi:hypothetical protein